MTDDRQALPEHFGCRYPQCVHEDQCIYEGCEAVYPAARRLRIGPLSVELLSRLDPGVAAVDVLRRRSFLRVLSLPCNRLLVVGWLGL